MSIFIFINEKLYIHEYIVTSKKHGEIFERVSVFPGSIDSRILSEIREVILEWNPNRDLPFTRKIYIAISEGLFKL